MTIKELLKKAVYSNYELTDTDIKNIIAKTGDHVPRSKPIKLEDYCIVKDLENVLYIFVKKTDVEAVKKIDGLSSLIYDHPDNKYAGYEIFSTITYYLDIYWRLA